MKEYALYKGDELLGIGTAKELAELRGCEPKSIQFLGTPTYKKRLMARGNPWDSLALIELDMEVE